MQSIAFSPDGKLLASAGMRREIILWDVATGQRSKIIVRANDVRDRPRPPQPVLPAPPPMPPDVVTPAY